MKYTPGRRRQPLAIAVLFFAALPLAAQSTQEPVDLSVVQRLKDEGFNRSQVMETLSYLTDVHGPRLTNSPNMRRAAEYVRERMKTFGIDNVQFETWGDFGRGWVNDHTAIHVTSPTRWPVVGFSKAWAPGTTGVVTGEVVAPSLADDAALAAAAGSLTGKWVLLSPARQVSSITSPLARRYADEDLQALSRQEAPNPPAVPTSAGPGRGGRGGGAGGPAQVEEFRRKRMAWLVAEGAAGIVEVSPGDRNDNLTVRVQGPTPGEGTRDPKDPPPLPQLVVAAEHYHRMLRLIGLGHTVTLEADVRNRFFDDDLSVYNIVAELPGTDRADELVLLGAHFDSWHGGTGATDNGASSAVIMEAMRLLKATGVPLRRTVRMVLWTGEEQGLLGSRAYVARHFGGRANTPETPAHAKVSAYFNQDNGAGAYRGIYLQGNESVAPIFRAWMQPFENLGMRTLSIRNTGSTDHVPFEEAALPGFQFIQDPMDYGSWTHHTQQDLYERVNPRDMVTNAVILASFVYHAANRDAMLPRKAR